MINVLLILLAAPACLLAQSGSNTTLTTTTTTTTTPQPVIPCGGYLTDPNGTITSPGYPQPYFSAAECIWVISALSPAQIVLQFNDFDLEGNSLFLCEYDYLDVRDGNSPTSTLLGKFCGSDLPSPLVTSGPAMWIKFNSDESVNRGGFHISYQVIANGTRLPSILNVTAPCGGNRTSLTGEILSPGYPRQYRPLEDCVWTVEAPLNHQITLTFNGFELEDNCGYDSLTIWNGPSELSPLVGMFCGQNPPPANIILDTNKARLRFVSDVSWSFNGFNITYDASPMGCGRRENSTNGTFAAPGYPANKVQQSTLPCVWQFQTNPGNQLELAFSYINSTYMKVRTGDSQGQQVDLPMAFSPAYNITDYHARGGFYTVPIHNNSVWVEYAPALPNTWRHTFFAMYRTVCDVTVNDMHGVIESPGFPRGYAPFMNCSWKLEAPSGLRYFLYLETVDLEVSDNCRYDSVTVFDGADPETRQQVAVECHSGQQIVLMSGRTGMIQFKTDELVVEKGFRIIYHAIPPPSTTTTTTTTTTTSTATPTTTSTTTTTPTTTTTAPTTTTSTTTTAAPTTTTPTTTPAPTTTIPKTTSTTPTTTTTTTPAPTTTTSTETTTNEEKTNVAANTSSSHGDSSAIAGGVVGGVIIIIIIVIAVAAFLWWRRRTNSNLPFSKFTNGNEGGVTMSGLQRGH